MVVYYIKFKVKGVEYKGFYDPYSEIVVTGKDFQSDLDFIVRFFTDPYDKKEYFEMSSKTVQFRFEDYLFKNSKEDFDFEMNENTNIDYILFYKLTIKNRKLIDFEGEV